MTQEQILKNCRFCKSSKIKLIFKKDDIFIFKCLDCGIVFLGNDLDEGAIKDLYKYYGYSAFSNYLSPITKIRYEKLLDSFEQYRKNNTIIDVGCGAGYFMLSASNRGWNVDGAEISDEAIKLAEEKCQHVFKGDISSLSLERDKYDIATLFEIIEHASNPEDIIEKLSSILRSGGFIYITTPNYNSIARRFLGERWNIFHKEHFFYFTNKTLRALLKKYGFRIETIRTENISIVEILKIFKKEKQYNFNECYEKQELVRTLAEKRQVFSIVKRLVNFILNILGLGDTIYILAVVEKK